MSMLEFEAYSEKIKAEFAKRAPNAPMLYGRKIFSQNDEDGITLHLLEAIRKFMPLTRTFIEFGTGSGLQNNTYTLLLRNFSGCWIDKTDYSIIAGLVNGARFPRLLPLNKTVSLDTLPKILEDCIRFLGTENIDFFSMDLDYNDWYFVKHALTILKPKIICVEYNAKFPPPMDIKVAYAADGVWKLDDYQGASLQAFVNLLDEYRLVACSLAGVNAFFVHNSLASLFPEYDIETLYQPARYALGNYLPGHKPSISWLADALASEESGLAGAILVTPPCKRAVPFFVHQVKDNIVSECITRYRRWETLESAILERVIERNDYFLDLGANIGWFTVLAALCVGNGGKVLAVEPGSANFAVLSKNIFAISNLTGHLVQGRRLAISDANGEGQLYLAPLNLGDHRIYKAPQERSCENISLQNLETLLACDNRLPDVVKMDTQGAEAAILRGAGNLFSKGWRPIWLFEFSPAHLSGAGCNPPDLLFRFAELGYELWRIDSAARKLLPVQWRNNDDFVFAQMREKPNDGIDLVAVTPDSPRKNKLREFF